MGSGVERAVPGGSEHVPLTWDELLPYEQQQGGYWLYGTDPFGADKRWIPVRRVVLLSRGRDKKGPT